MPVTHGVASSSLVRTAKALLKRGLFLYPKGKPNIRCECSYDPFKVHYVVQINITGLTGFDSKDNGFVSMQAHTSAALKTDVKQ